jgi:hypothetical protein
MIGGQRETETKTGIEEDEFQRKKTGKVQRDFNFSQ